MLFRPNNDYGTLMGRPPRPLWRRYLWWWLAPLLVFDVWLVRRLWPRSAPPEDGIAPPVAAPARVEAAVGDRRWTLIFPTPQTRLMDEPDADIFMPTAAGRVESALYGSTRTSGQGGNFLPSFHEGIDIASTLRDRRGLPLDPVFAAADGRIAYLNRHAGNSNYGIYVVLLHDDPMGEIYTLYAHLARVADDVREGQAVAAGATLGTMGNTPASIIPAVRSHLHFELGVMQNARFARWYRAQRMTPDHGNLHGMNLTGIDPLSAFAARDADGRFSMAELLARTPTAFEVACVADRLPDYFRRYAALWRGDPFAPGAIVLGVSEGGVVLHGRRAAPEEASGLTDKAPRVIFADEAVLGRNGRRLVVRRDGAWTLGRNGERWLEVLLY